MYDSLKLENQLCFPIYLCSKEIIRKYSPLLKKIDLTYTQYIVMMYLWENGESSLREIGKGLKLESSTLTPLAQKLESKGFLKRKKSNVDERNLIITLTKKGNDLKKDALDVPKYMGKCISLNEEESITLYRLLYKVLDNIEKE